MLRNVDSNYLFGIRRTDQLYKTRYPVGQYVPDTVAPVAKGYNPDLWPLIGLSRRHVSPSRAHKETNPIGRGSADDDNYYGVITYGVHLER